MLLKITKPSSSVITVNVFTILGITLIELVLVLAIIGILSAITIPTFQNYLKKLDMDKAKADIMTIELRIDRFYSNNFRLPTNTAELGSLPDDPWGTPYIYLNIGIQKGKGKLRKDKNLVPINTDYDLYSKGPDGMSVSPLTAKQSRDDIVRAHNGAFIGPAQDY